MNFNNKRTKKNELLCHHCSYCGHGRDNGDPVSDGIKSAVRKGKESGGQVCRIGGLKSRIQRNKKIARMKKQRAYLVCGPGFCMLFCGLRDRLWRASALCKPLSAEPGSSKCIYRDAGCFRYEGKGSKAGGRRPPPGASGEYGDHGCGRKICKSKSWGAGA